MMDLIKSNPIQDEVTQHEVEFLGSMLLAPNLISRIETIVDPEDFKDSDHGKLYAAFMTLHTAGKNVFESRNLLATELKRMRAISGDLMASAAYIAKLINSVPNAAHIVYYAEQIKFAAHKRRLNALALEIMRLSAERDSDQASDISAIERKISMLSEAREHNARTVAEIAADMVQEIEAKSKMTVEHKPGIFTGLSSHDSTTGPLMPGELCILAARPGCGKTALAMQWAKNVAERKRRVLFVSMEMKDRELVGRMLAPLADVPPSVIRSQSAQDDEISKLKEAASQLQGMPLVVWDQPRATIGRIRGISKYMIATGGLNALFIDYLGLIRSESKQFIPRHEQIAQITGELKIIAKELHVPIVCLCQLNREADAAAPKLSNLRESGSIEQDADMVIFIHHLAEDKNDSRNVSLIVAKNRHGAIGQTKLFWVPHKTLFEEQAEWTG